MKIRTLFAVTFLLCVIMLVAGCSKSEAIYTAGVYTAAAEGYEGSVSVEVEFDEHSILEV